jgi:hypothetical protein
MFGVSSTAGSEAPSSFAVSLPPQAKIKPARREGSRVRVERLRSISNLERRLK